MNAVDSLDLGPLWAEHDGQSVTLLTRSRSEVVAVLDADQIRELFQWVADYRPRESNRRMAFRIPVSPAMNLQARWSIRGCCGPASVTNISLTGVLLEHASLLPPLQIGESVALQLTRSGVAVPIEAHVHSIRERAIALVFSARNGSGERIDNPRLRELVVELQREWIAQRATRSLPESEGACG